MPNLKRSIGFFLSLSVVSILGLICGMYGPSYSIEDALTRLGLNTLEFVLSLVAVLILAFLNEIIKLIFRSPWPSFLEIVAPILNFGRRIEKIVLTINFLIFTLLGYYVRTHTFGIQEVFLVLALFFILLLELKRKWLKK